MFADLASIHPRICPKRLTAIALRRRQIRDHTVKDHPSRTQQNPTSTIIDCRELACRAREEHQLIEPVPPLSRDTYSSRLAARVNLEIREPLLLRPVALPLQTATTIPRGGSNIGIRRNRQLYSRFHIPGSCHDLLSAC